MNRDLETPAALQGTPGGLCASWQSGFFLTGTPSREHQRQQGEPEARRQRRQPEHHDQANRQQRGKYEENGRSEHLAEVNEGAVHR